MAQISVIIATKNCFEKIDATMLSLFRQSVKDIEIICVDDVSTDNTLKLLNNYAEFDKRVQVVDNKKSVGLIKSLQIGLNKATAPYVVFLNGTHHILLVQAFLERLLNSAQKNSSDIVYTQTAFVDAVKITAHNMCIFQPKIFAQYVGKEVFKATDVPAGLLFNFYLSPYIKLYRKDFVENLDFDAFDEEFFLNALLAAERISAELDFLCYRQVQNQELENPQVFAEQSANRRVLEKYGVWNTHNIAYIVHKMQSAWWSLQFSSQKEEMFEKIKTEFKTENFGEYDFNQLRQIKLYWTIQSLLEMSWKDFNQATDSAQ